jgi:hypothetical protein
LLFLYLIFFQSRELHRTWHIIELNLKVFFWILIRVVCIRRLDEKRLYEKEKYTWSPKTKIRVTRRSSEIFCFKCVPIFLPHPVRIIFDRTEGFM